jgi:hypothetical protein
MAPCLFVGTAYESVWDFLNAGSYSISNLSIALANLSSSGFFLSGSLTAIGTLLYALILLIKSIDGAPKPPTPYNFNIFAL